MGQRRNCIVQSNYSRVLSWFYKDLQDWVVLWKCLSFKQGAWLLYPCIKPSLDEGCPWGGSTTWWGSSFWLRSMTGEPSVTGTRSQQLGQRVAQAWRRGTWVVQCSIYHKSKYNNSYKMLGGVPDTSKISNNYNDNYISFLEDLPKCWHIEFAGKLVEYDLYGFWVWVKVREHWVLYERSWNNCNSVWPVFFASAITDKYSTGGLALLIPPPQHSVSFFFLWELGAPRASTQVQERAVPFQ